MIAPVLINGVLYSWCNMNHIAFGLPVTGIRGISYSRKQISENVMGAGREPVGIAYGGIAYEASITVIKDWWKAVKNAAPGKDPFAILPFNWTISYGNAVSPGTPPVNPFTETLQNWRFLEDNTKSNTGDTGIFLDIPCAWAGLQET